MITLGVDIGTGTTKGVLMEDGNKILAMDLDVVKGRPDVVATRMMDNLLETANVEKSELNYIASTGYGRYQMNERQIQITDLTSTGRGANFVYDEPHIILDIGNQSSRALRVSETGKIIQFKVNERCAAGSGRFIERCSKYLTIPMEQVSEISLKADKPQQISSVCAVLSETEIINHVSLGVSVENIFMGVLISIADRAATLLKRVKLDEDIYLTGGLVLLPAMTKALEKVIDYRVHVHPDAHYAAAIGAAKLGYQRALKKIVV
ncbi:MAG: Benzoyl-CoA reductase subunit D [Candidatus Heimdallarchaeota archaeon LC_2]|nr:MAG: Benzoyl-CoA reductase subunit D [Candidatus Heimdallarchaeota archaeon LC_2]